MTTLEEWFVSQGGDIEMVKSRYPGFPWSTWHLSVGAICKAILVNYLKYN